MPSEVLNVIIDERKDLNNLDSAGLMNLGRQFGASMTSNRRVFKDYLFSTDPYYIDSSLS